MTPRPTRLEPLFALRLMAGTVFASEGVQKFPFPSELGGGRFLRIGIPWPHVIAPFVGAVELVGGMMLIFDLLTTYAALALLLDISVAIVSTKIPILLGRAVGPFPLPKLSSYGLWSFAHETRTDWCMLLACVAIVLSRMDGPSRK